MKDKIDLNCDLAEGIGNEAELMPWITSANIACGYHAGDEDLMKSTVELCLRHKVAIGVHPSFADRASFGRTPMNLSMEEVTQLIQKQIYLLKGITESLGGKLHHVKPHGALYNMAAKDPLLAACICTTIAQIDKSLIFYGLSGSVMIDEARKAGLKSAHEVFADRTYQPDGSLTPRTELNALITDELTAVNQVILFAKERKVIDTVGNYKVLEADTVCLHGDGKHAVPFARLINSRLKQAGVSIETLSQQ